MSRLTSWRRLISNSFPAASITHSSLKHRSLKHGSLYSTNPTLKNQLSFEVEFGRLDINRQPRARESSKRLMANRLFTKITATQAIQLKPVAAWNQAVASSQRADAKRQATHAMAVAWAAAVVAIRVVHAAAATLAALAGADSVVPG